MGFLVSYMTKNSRFMYIFDFFTDCFWHKFRENRCVSTVWEWFWNGKIVCKHFLIVKGTEQTDQVQQE